MYRRSFQSIARVALAGVLLAVSAASVAWAQPSAPRSAPPPGPAALEQIPILKDAGLQQRLNNALPLDAMFVDEEGKDVRLGSYFGERPVVLVLSYYECPILCTQVLNGLAGTLETMPFTPGKEFDVLAVSFDPGETPAMARSRRTAYLRRYDKPETQPGVHFLTGREDSIKSLTDAVGFHYAYDEKIDQYAHPALITILTPEGRVSKYLFGIEYGPRDLRLALVEAANHRIGSAVDQMLLFCYHYDPESGKYGLAITNVIRLAGILTVAALGAFIFVNLRRERRQDSAVDGTATGIR